MRSENTCGVRLPGSAAQIVASRLTQLVGARWTLLILRHAFEGTTRFTDFHLALGIPRDVLANRLNALVDAGILERQTYTEPDARSRSGYHLTADGRELAPMLVSLAQWCRDRDATESVVAFSTLSEQPVHVVVLDEAGSPVEPGDIRLCAGDQLRHT